MERVNTILKQISLSELISDYKNGMYFSEKANKLINSQHLDCEIIEYSDRYIVNFYEEDNDDNLIETFTEYK